MSSRVLGPVLALVVLGGGAYAYFALRGEPEQPVVPTENRSEPVPDQPKFEPRVVLGPFTVDVKAIPREDRFELPDGSWVLALNGVKNAARLEWPKDRPYAPIVARVLQRDGTERYKHADGSWSWTQPQWRADLNRMDSVTVLGNPQEALPMAPDEAEAERKRLQEQGR